MSWFSDFVEQTTGYDPPDLADEAAIAFPGFDPVAAAAAAKKKLESVNLPSGIDPQSVVSAAGASLMASLMGNQMPGGDGWADEFADAMGGGKDTRPGTSGGGSTPDTSPPSNPGTGDGAAEDDVDDPDMRAIYDRFGRSDTILTGGYGDGATRRRSAGAF